MNADRVENNLAGGHGDHEDDRGVNAQHAAPSDAALPGVSEAVSPANSATFPIGSIVVKSVAKSLLTLDQERGHVLEKAYTFALCERQIRVNVFSLLSSFPILAGHACGLLGHILGGRPDLPDQIAAFIPARLGEQVGTGARQERERCLP